ncbi:MAG: hypothetical protein HYZ45_03680 [Burkholderiales bacterium]|nr:hypothetical protein [Burkholderiales bacterium]
MKIIVKTSSKPRNPMAVVARQRKAGSHDAHNTARYQRRQQKQVLGQIVRGKEDDC